jgi:threonyl-tRNA synthetase
MLIVGEKEEADGVVSVRVQGEGDKGQMTAADFAKLVADAVAKEIEPIQVAEK